MLTIVGNGTNRVMPTYGKDRFWGCNAFYRDANPEILFTVDIPMQREVIEWGYAEANKVAVGNWEILPIDMIEPLKMGFGNTKIIESISPDSEYLVVQGDDEVTTFLGLSSPQMKNIIMYNNPELKNLFCGMSALGYAMLNGEKEITLTGFNALEDDNWSNNYEGTQNYLHKYSSDSRVLNAQRSQFIALLEEFEDVKVYFKNPLTGTVKVEYNELYYYEDSERWILGEGLESDTMR
tara:strand:- start:2908 stop:3618 length:711 start_codon:yes stop_codon:yes gene_type:complete